MERINRNGIAAFRSAGGALLILLVTAGVSRAQLGVQVTSGAPAVTLPSSAPFNTIGAQTQPSRFEARIFNFNGALPSKSYTGLSFGPFYLLQFTATQIYLSSNFNSDTLAGTNGVVTGPCCSQYTDIVVRAQRDVANSRWTLELCSAQSQSSSTCATGTSPITAFGQPSWAGMQLVLTSGYAVGFLRWFSTAVPVGTPIALSGTQGDIADWEFQNSLRDSVHGLTFSGGSVSYVSQPTYPPSCNPGAQVTFRAGYPASLDGSASYSLNINGLLSYKWAQLSGPSTLSWTGQNRSQPTIKGLVFGTYVFQLTVTDSSGKSSTCTVKDGAVATDDNNLVITGNSLVDTLLGPMVRYGANPWPWYDNRHLAAANVQIANLDTYYSAYWNVAGAGTVTVSAGSPIVTGSGTTFTTTFCGGASGSPSTSNGTGIIVWYPIPATGQTGRRGMQVASCQSDTQLTLTQNWGPWNGVAAGSGLSYATDSGTSAWEYNTAPANYYDNVAGLYSLYYRSGIDDYLNAARKLADRFWTSPQIDRGEACDVTQGGLYGCFPARSLSMMGIVLRAQELAGTPNDMWSGLHLIWNTFMSYYLNGVDVTWGPGLWDVREVSYHLAMISYCAMADTDPGFRSTCAASINNSFASIWTPWKLPDGGWGNFYGSMTSWATKTSVTLTNGSATVVGNGTNWTAANFPSGTTIWFTPSPAVEPLNNGVGDPVIYTPTFVDATHLTLDRSYAGSTGTHGYAVSDLTYGQVGWTIEPFMEGLLGSAFDLAAKAIAGTYPATATLAHQYNVSTADWLENVGYWPDARGMYYFAESMNCQPPIADTNMACIYGEDTQGARVLNAESLRAVMAAYAYNNDPNLLAFANNLYSAMWSKPGTGGPNPDSNYITAMDDGGFYMTGAPPIGSAPKYFGMFFGFPSLSAWPGIQVGGLQPQVNQPVAVDFDPGAFAHAASARVQLILPSGLAVAVNCAAAPCVVNSDARQGTPLLSVQYLSQQGNVIAESQPAPIQ